MLTIDITILYKKHNLADDLYNRACILASLIEDRKLTTSVQVNTENLLEFTINNEIILTFIEVEKLRCTIDNNIKNIPFGRYYLIPILDSIKDKKDE